MLLNAAFSVLNLVFSLKIFFIRRNQWLLNILEFQVLKFKMEGSGDLQLLRKNKITISHFFIVISLRVYCVFMCDAQAFLLRNA